MLPAPLTGVGALLAGAMACIVVAVDGDGSWGGGFAGSSLTIYGPGQAALAVALVLTGALLVLPHIRHEAVLLAIAGLLAAQIAGTGLVGFRRWPLYWGCCAPSGITEQALVRALALLLAGAGGVAALLCARRLVRTRHSWSTGPQGMGAAAVAGAATVALVGPLLVVHGDPNADVRDLLAWGVTYALPYAAALALAGWMRTRAALTLLGAVALSTVAAHAGAAMLELRQPWGAALVLVLGVVGVVGVGVLGTAATRAATSPRTPAA
ncbi:hypothetical protein [Nocardioides lacusdianchii]|uniref:hypothetical protein n=1 Tax=Nocardioides lacusdianchii TaxID=2783664 RepID=UPI001CCF2CBB|nr:hypothetical protein [Nocardioides lacusdianchii]